MRRKPFRQAMILPGGQYVPYHQASQFEGFVEEPFTSCPGHGKYQKSEDDPVRNAHDSRTTFNDPSACRLNLQLASRQLTIRLDILFTCPPRNFLGEGGGGRLFVPANFFEVIPYILLVVGILRLARLIGVGRPEARG